MNWRRIGAIALSIWFGLLLLSTAVRFVSGFQADPQPYQLLAKVPASLDWAVSDEVLLAYREYGTGNQETPILLLHGNPMAGRAMRPLGQLLGEKRPVLSPDLPGLGFTSRNLKAYSAENQALVLHAWLEQQLIEAVDLIAYSQGGPVAFEMADRYPELIRSITLVSAVGLQEHELLGHYALNQPIYKIYKAGLWSL
ncbi:MAG: alpha/beta fold hydrolase, partial [Opitutales bacterium]